MLDLQCNVNFVIRGNLSRNRHLAPRIFDLFRMGEIEFPARKPDAVGRDADIERGMRLSDEGAKREAKKQRSIVLRLDSESHFGDRTIGPDTYSELGAAPSRDQETRATTSLVKSILWSSE